MEETVCWADEVSLHNFDAKLDYSNISFFPDREIDTGHGQRFKDASLDLTLCHIPSFPSVWWLEGERKCMQIWQRKHEF